MRTLVVGGAGYLGGSVIDILEQSNIDFMVFDSLLYEESYRRDVPFVYGDIRDTKLLKKYLKWADVVVWLAALVGDGACALDQQLTKEVNSDSIKFLADNFNGKIIYTSSCSCYGAGSGILTETSKLNPLSHYAITKLWGEQNLKNKDAIIFRLGTLFGISNHFSRIRTDLVLNTLVCNAHARGKLSVFGGRQFRPLIHVKDVAKIICDSLTSKEQGIFNLHKKNITILELAKKVQTYFPKLELDITKTKFEDNRDYRVCSDKAKKLLNFNPTLSLGYGIEQVKTILDEHRIKNPFSNRYSNVKHLTKLFGGKK